MWNSTDPDLIEAFEVEQPSKPSKIKGYHDRSPGGSRFWVPAAEARAAHHARHCNSAPTTTQPPISEQSSSVAPSVTEPSIVVPISHEGEGTRSGTGRTRSGQTYAASFSLHGQPVGSGGDYEILQLIKTFAKTSDDMAIDVGRLYQALQLSAP